MPGGFQSRTTGQPDRPCPAGSAHPVFGKLSSLLPDHARCRATEASPASGCRGRPGMQLLSIRMMPPSVAGRWRSRRHRTGIRSLSPTTRACACHVRPAHRQGPVARGAQPILAGMRWMYTRVPRHTTGSGAPFTYHRLMAGFRDEPGNRSGALTAVVGVMMGEAEDVVSIRAWRTRRVGRWCSAVLAKHGAAEGRSIPVMKSDGAHGTVSPGPFPGRRTPNGRPTLLGVERSGSRPMPVTHGSCRSVGRLLAVAPRPLRYASSMDAVPLSTGRGADVGFSQRPSMEP